MGWTERSEVQMVELDATCRTCQARNMGVYRMRATCTNCGSAAIVVMSRGHRTGNIRPPCPTCGCYDWSYDKESRATNGQMPEALQQAVETVLATAAAYAAALREAINWGDVHCVEVRPTDTGWLVTVGEASPSAVGLQAYLRHQLAQLGWADVEVRTEW
jgi:transposase-like protein